MTDMTEMKYSVCVCVFNEDSNILAVSRRGQYTAFGLPGGKVDPEDGALCLHELNICSDTLKTCKTATIRELSEETGIKLMEYHLDFVYAGIENDDEFVCCGFLSTTRIDTCCVNTGINSEDSMVQWVHPSVLIDGPFGRYNAKMMSHILYQTMQKEK